jgi:hypothetical protein
MFPELTKMHTRIAKCHGDMAVAGTAFTGQYAADNLPGNIECQTSHYGYSGLVIEV